MMRSEVVTWQGGQLVSLVSTPFEAKEEEEAAQGKG